MAALRCPLVRQQAVNIKLGSRADVDLAVSYSGNRKFHSVSCFVCRFLGTIPKLTIEICRVIRMENLYWCSEKWG